MYLLAGLKINGVHFLKHYLLPFYGAFVAKRERFRSFAVTPQTGRSPRWDLRPFSARDSCQKH
jgi:hypothetical protein